MQQWRIRIKGNPRQGVDKALLIQAVIALGKQRANEARPVNREVHQKERGEGA
jgi:hypothetical protein